jgi:uncharacterized protein (TIGR03435 family)
LLIGPPGIAIAPRHVTILAHIRSHELLAVGILGARSQLGERIALLLQRQRTFSTRASVANLAAGCLALGALLLTGALVPRWIAFAQQQPRLEFEVASIKPSAPGERTTSNTTPGGRATYTNWAAKSLVQVAWDIPGFWVSGGPDWIKAERFDIVAKATDSAAEDLRKTTNDQLESYRSRMLRRLQMLLADRFQLKFHREIKEMPGYALVLAKNGPKFHEATDAGPGLDEMKRPDGGKGAGIRARGGTRDANGRFLGGGSFKGQMATMAMFADTITRTTGLPVIDKTGLRGRYDFAVEWAPDPSAPTVETAAAPDNSGPSVFSALQQQLGLRLEAARVPVETLVIDHIEKPDAN